MNIPNYYEGMATGSELARRYRVTQPTINNWYNRWAKDAVNPFPEPALVVPTTPWNGRPYWNIADVDEWVKRFRERNISQLPVIPDSAGV